MICSTVLSQVSHLGLTGAASAACIAPSRWVQGQTFHCFIYDGSSQQVGDYKATILPSTSSGVPEWNGALSGVTNTGPSGNSGAYVPAGSSGASGTS